MMSRTGSQLEETVAWLVDIPSVTGAEEAICSAVAARLAGLAQTRVRESLVVGRPDARPAVVLAGHLDTVPSQGQGTARLEDGRIHGLGAADMKSGLAVMIHLLENAAPVAGSHNIVGVFYAGEEGPHAGNQLEDVLAEVDWLQEASCAVVLEPSDGQLQLGCNGVINASVTFLGRTAHSARPWWGENAVTKAGDWLGALHRLEPRSHRIDGLEFRRVVSVTRAEGGIANNIVPGEFNLNVNMRFTPDTTLESATAELAELCAPADRFQVVDTAPAGAVAADHPLISRLAKVSGAERGAKQGWTDVARFSARGIPAVNFGPGESSQAHQADESVGMAAVDTVYRALADTLGQSPATA